jgi:hypothetical protein
MKAPLTAALIAATLTLATLTRATAQETEIPDDSRLVSLNGCAKNGTFVVGDRREDQPGSLEVEPGRRFRLNGPKKLLDEIRARQRGAMQVTGLLRKADVNGPQGIGLLGGRVRIGGARVPQDPIANPARDPAYNQPVLDVRSWKSLSGDCR